MADKNFNPNARYDNGPSAAGSGRASTQAVLQGAPVVGNGTDACLGGANLFMGFSEAGARRNNTGPNVAGAPRAYAPTTLFFSGTNKG